MSKLLWVLLWKETEPKRAALLVAAGSVVRGVMARGDDDENSWTSFLNITVDVPVVDVSFLWRSVDGCVAVRSCSAWRLAGASEGGKSIDRDV
jgi:hypothetical protein